MVTFSVKNQWANRFKPNYQLRKTSSKKNQKKTESWMPKTNLDAQLFKLHPKLCLVLFLIKEIADKVNEFRMTKQKTKQTFSIPKQSKENQNLKAHQPLHKPQLLKYPPTKNKKTKHSLKKQVSSLKNLRDSTFEELLVNITGWPRNCRKGRKNYWLKL